MEKEEKTAEELDEARKEGSKLEKELRQIDEIEKLYKEGQVLDSDQESKGQWKTKIENLLRES